MSGHTKEPWKAEFISEQGWSILDENKNVIALLASDDIESGDPVENDAHRIESCVNACAGIPLERLVARRDYQAPDEDYGDAYGLGFLDGTEYAETAIKHRQKLLAAIHDALTSESGPDLTGRLLKVQAEIMEEL